MKNKNKEKTHFDKFIYILATLLAAFFVANIVSGIAKTSFFQGSVLAILNKIGLTDFSEEYPDAGIDYVYLQKISNPTPEFSYYKYKATIVVRNYGELLENGDITVTAGNNQKTAFIRNNLDGLTLGKGETFIFDDYEVLMDGRDNYGKYTFKIDTKGGKDRSLDNNSYVVDVFEEPVKFESFGVTDKKGDNFVLSTNPLKEFEDSLSKMNLEICIAENYKIPKENELKYSETDTSKDVYSYYKIKASKKLITDENFKCESLGKSEEFGAINRFFDSKTEYSVFLKAFADNEDKSNFFAVSNVLDLPVQEFINRAEFAKAFVDDAGITLITEGKHYYKDIEEGAWYSPYVQTMFNYGLLKDTENFEFGPNNAVSRRDIFEPLLNYFDVELKIDEGAPHYADIDKNSKDFFFTEAIYSSGKAKALGIYFHPEKRASRNFLKYLINEFLETQN